MFNRNKINNPFTQHKGSEFDSKVKIKCLQCNTQWIRIEFLHKLEERGQNYNCSFPHYLSFTNFSHRQAS